MMTQDSVKSLIEAVDKADSADGLLEAVKALAAAHHPDAIDTLIEVLRFNNPGAAVAAVDGLIELGDIAVSPILANLDGYNYGARAWATRALSGIGDPRALDLLLEAATEDFSLSVRRAAARGLGNIQWAKLPTEEIPKAQKTAVETLVRVTDDEEWVVRYGAVTGLDSLCRALNPTQSDLRETILARLQELLEKDEELVVRTRVRMALQQVRA